MNIYLARLERNARPPFRHIERIGDAHDAGFERQRLAIAAVRDDRVQNFRADDRGRSDWINTCQQLANNGLRDEQAVLLVVNSMNGDTQIVEQRSEHDDHLGVAVRHLVIAHNARYDAAIHQLPQQLERDVRHDLKVYRAVIAHPQPLDCVDIHRLPKRVQFLVRVHMLDHFLQRGVVPRGNPDRDVRFLRRLERFVNQFDFTRFYFRHITSWNSESPRRTEAIVL